MEGVSDGRVGIATQKSLGRAEIRKMIEKAQAELSQQYAEREECRRELEFLEKGGNPLDFKYSDVASVTVQSTQSAPEQFTTQETKHSFSLTASPQGDFIESSGRPEASPVRKQHCAESEFHQGDGTFVLPTRDRIAPLEQSSQFDGNQNAKESGDSNVFGLLKSQAYK